MAGLAVIGVAGYDFAITLSDEKLENKIINEINLIKEIDCNGYRVGNGSYLYFYGNQNQRPRTCRDRDAEKQPRLQIDGSHTYKLILIFCLLAAIILGFVQSIGSSIVVCSCNSVSLSLM